MKHNYKSLHKWKQTFIQNIKQNHFNSATYSYILQNLHSNLISTQAEHWNSSLDSHVVMIIVSHTCIKNDFQATSGKTSISLKILEGVTKIPITDQTLQHFRGTNITQCGKNHSTKLDKSLKCEQKWNSWTLNSCPLELLLVWFEMLLV